MTTNKGFKNEEKFSQKFKIELSDKQNLPFNEGSDTKNGISLKSNRFSVPAIATVTEKTEENKRLLIENHYQNTASRCYCITIYGKFYFMSPNIFKEAMIKFSRLDRDSKRNGGKIKIRCGATKKMAKWLETQGIHGIA